MTSIRAFLIILVGVAGLLVSQSPSADAAVTPRSVLLKRINEVRHAHGLPALRASKALTKVAAKHSYSMIRGRYFAHTSPGGSTLQKRVLASGFVDGYSWTAGENLAWGTGNRALPRYVVKGWMNSPTHRAILMTSGFRYVGISRYCGTFLGYRDACVWTADFVGRS
ncbi:MAG: hypothetical protein QOJ13_3485 [Gaiellales bacterium]|jgi:uncharacterized protein YkwD|nr:hypothetical protein [Gaiellales bacterium]MDX6594289.1 hypothetical protein [Gaiellales bacterium]